MNDVVDLLQEIERYCQANNMAPSTFGRQAVNDGKFVGRLREGGNVTMATLERVRGFLDDGVASVTGQASPAMAMAPALQPPPTSDDTSSSRNFRFYDNRQKYLMFVNTCSEKRVVAERVGQELVRINPSPPALRLFDAGMGDGTILTSVMRQMHRRFPTYPFFVVGKEISLEDVRLSLEKMSDRFFEHPATVLVLTNLYYSESPWLKPGTMQAAASLNWIEQPLAGTSAYEFDEQISDMQETLAECWQVRYSEKTGNPLYVRPSVLVLYREDHKFLLDPVIPRIGNARADYDIVIASQPYRARQSAEFKVEKVLAPLAKSLAPGGRLLVIQSHGGDPGLEIVRRVWPGESPFRSDRHELVKVMKQQLGRTHRDLKYGSYADARAVFQYQMHTLPTEIGLGQQIGTSTLLAAWNAATYVAQIEDSRLEDVMSGHAYLDATRDVLAEYGGLWFNDEAFVVSRRR